jgi:SAM-dependent methyltransferase
MRWGWQQYRPTLLKLVEQFQLQDAMEIGGGRSPSFDQETIQQHFGSYSVNDIAQSELDRSPDYVAKQCFDVAAKNDNLPEESYDLLFSKMVFEHIPDAEQAYRNIHTLLRPGGIAVNFMPTLFCPPFVINLLLPERLGKKILEFFFPTRNDDGHPKFPAYYDWCFSTEKRRQRIQALGFSEVEIVPFYHHGYFEKIPGLKQVDGLFSSLAEKRDWRFFTSYAYAIVRK